MSVSGNEGIGRGGKGDLKSQKGLIFSVQHNPASKDWIGERERERTCAKRGNALFCDWPSQDFDSDVWSLFEVAITQEVGRITLLGKDVLGTAPELVLSFHLTLPAPIASHFVEEDGGS